MNAPTKTVEVDPRGLSQHEPGAKLDAGKIRAGLVINGFPRALMAVCEVGTHGAQKYTDNGWHSVPDGVSRYTDAMHRHLLEEARGEEFDPDSGLMHAAHAAWNAIARLELLLRLKESPRQRGWPVVPDANPTEVGKC